MKIRIEEVEHMFKLTTIGEAFPTGYKDDVYEFICTSNNETSVDSYQLKYAGTLYTAVYDPRDNGLIECNSNFESVAKDFSIHLVKRFFIQIPEEELYAVDSDVYFKTKSALWHAAYDKRFLINLLPEGTIERRLDSYNYD